MLLSLNQPTVSGHPEGKQLLPPPLPLQPRLLKTTITLVEKPKISNNISLKMSPPG